MEIDNFYKDTSIFENHGADDMYDRRDEGRHRQLEEIVVDASVSQLVGTEVQLQSGEAVVVLNPEAGQASI